MNGQQAVQEIIKITDKAKTMEELHEVLHAIAYTIGGMVLHFEREDRAGVVISLCETLGQGVMKTSEMMGEPCDMSIEVGEIADSNKNG